MAAVLEHITEDTQINDAVHSDVAIGDAHPDRQVVVVLNSRGTEPTAMTVGSVSARRQKHEGFGSNFDASIWVADVPFGKTADITITGGDRYTAINVYRGVNVELYDAATDGGGGVDDSVAVTVDSGDASTVAGYHQEGAGGSITSWTGVTERSDASIDAGDADDTYSFADTLDDSTAGSLTVTATSTSSQAASALVAATFRSANVAREIVVEASDHNTSSGALTLTTPKGTNLLLWSAYNNGVELDPTAPPDLEGSSPVKLANNIWAYLRPPVNTAISIDHTTYDYQSLVAFSAVDLKSVIETFDVYEETTTGFTVPLGSLSDEVMIFGHASCGDARTITADDGQTELFNASHGSEAEAGHYLTVDTAAFQDWGISLDSSANRLWVFGVILQPQRLKSPAYQYEEVEGTLTRIDFNYGANDQGLLRQPLTENGTMTYAEGAAQFDGSTDYITSPSVTPYEDLTKITFSFWFKPDTVGSSTQVLFHNTITSTLGAHGVYIRWRDDGATSAVNCFVDDGSSWVQVDSASFSTSGEWIHVCLSIDSANEARLTVNGVVTTGSLSTALDFSTCEEWTLGRSTRTAETAYFDGEIADFRVIGRAVTDAEAIDLYARGRNNLPVRRKWDSDPDLVLDIDPRKGGIDRSGQSNALTLTGDTYIDEVGALKLDGSDDYAEIPDSDALHPASELTLAAWVYIDSFTETYEVVFDKPHTSHASPFYNYHLRFRSTDAYFWVDVGGGNTHSVTYSFTVNAGQWYHVVATYKSKTLTIYIDGEEGNSSTHVHASDTINDSGEPLRIGAFQNLTNGNFNGQILRPMISKRAWTNGEIKEVYKLTDPRLNLNADPLQRRQLHGCIGHWMAATEGRDLSGNGNPLGYEDGATVNGGAFEFDGGNYWYSTSASVDLPLTLALWVRADVASSMAFISSSSNSSAYIGTSTLDRYRFGWNGITQSLISIPSPVDGWHHVAQTIDAAGNSTYYIDGEEVGTGTGGTSGAHTLQLGKVSSFGATMDGAQDDIQVYNRALTNGEVTALYQSGVPYYERPERRKLTGEAFHISASEGAVQLSDGAGVTYNGDVSIVDNEYEFDGTGDFITTDYQFKPPFTILTWLDTDQTSSIAVAIGTEENSRTRIGTTTLNRWMFEWSSASSMLINGATTGLHLLALTVDSSGNAEAFADGVSIGTSTGASTSTSTLKIGRTFTTTTQDWDGSIADVKVYERVLNPEEIAIEYNNGTSGYEPSVNHLEAPYQAGGRWCPTITGDATDATDNGNNGTLTNGATTTTDYEDHGEAAFSTDGVNDYIAVSDIEAMDAVSEATWSVNFNPDAWDNNDFVIEKGGVFLLGKHASITPNEGGFAISDGAWNAVNFSSAPTLGEWLPAVATFDNGTLELFASGTSQGTLTGIGSIVNTTSAFNIAGRDTSFPFNGLSDDVMFLPRASHQAEVNWISSERGIQRPLDPYNPVAWWCPTHDFPNAETLNLMDLARTYHGDFESGMSATDDWVIDTSFGGTRAIDFDGTNDYVDVGSGLFNGWTQMSVSAWFYADALPTRGCVLAQMGSGSDFNFEFGPATSTSAGNEAVITIHDGTTQWKTFTNTAIPTGEWVHLASTWDGTDLKIFLNGLEDSNVNTQGTAGGSIRNVALTTRIGEYERDSEHFDGKVDDIKVYDRWLPPTAIKNLASKRGWTPEETTTITTAGDAAATTIFPFWAIIDNNNSFG